jgi:hypothetical protein
MAIRNTNLGGATNWTDPEVLYSADLNDTITAMANWAKTLTAFWLNADLRTLFDDFSGYTTDAAVPGTKWTLTTSTTGGDRTPTFITRGSTNAGGTNKEGELDCSNTYGASRSCTGSVKTVGLTANKHKYMKIYTSISHASGSSAPTTVGYLKVSFDKDSTTTTINIDGGDSNSQVTTQVASILTSITVIAKGSNQYDCYVGGKLVQTVTDASFEIRLNAYSQIANASNGLQTNKTYITDVYESSGSV